MSNERTGMDRRQFLQSASAATGAALMSAGIASGAPAATAPATAKKVKEMNDAMTVPPILGNVKTADEWPARREQIAATIRKYLGEPTPFERVEPKMRVLSESKEADYRQLKVAYDVEPGEEVRAHLLIPPPERRRKNAAVVCIHGTSAEAKDTMIGGGTKPGRDYGRFLAQHGFVTLSPDHCCSGERLKEGYKAYDSAPFYERHPEWSMVGKTIYDHQRAIDVLTQLDEVDPSRIGAIGHSLGGHGSMYLSAFDERVKAAVNSCGLTSWTGNPDRTHWSRDHWYIYIKKLRPALLSDSPPPFEMYDFAGLIAPRAFLNISGMTDYMYGPTGTLPQIGMEIQRVYDLVGASDKFANFLFGTDHNVPHYSRTLSLGWLEHWLADVQA